MVDKQEIRRLLKQYFRTTGKITISDEGLISCKGNVELKRVIKHKRLPVAFDRVDGSFVCDWNEFETLEGAPKSVGGGFYCSINQLTTLEHSPQSVGGDFSCYNNQLTTLEHSPQSVHGHFDCSYNQLTTLEGAPKSVGGSFACYNNQLTTLEGAPKIVGKDFWCNNNQLTTLEGMPAILGTLYLSYSPTLPLLRCLLAKKVELRPRLEDKTVENILNKYAGQGRRVIHLCAKELIAAGFEENAKW